MRMAELSRASGVPVATIKFYLREGLLPRGEVTTSPNQARYSEAHLRRLALVRSMVEVGGVSIAVVRRVLESLDDPADPLHHTMGLTLEATEQPAAEDDAATHDAARLAAERRIDEIIAAHGWRLSPDTPPRRVAIEVLAAMTRLAGDRFDGVAAVYADAADLVAGPDLDTVSSVADPETRVETALIGTVLGERLLGAMRRMAHENGSAHRFPS
jgi:DNA-binding transcriptional MerR regulator